MHDNTTDLVRNDETGVPAMALVLIALLVIGWIVVVARWRDRPMDPAASVDDERRALAAIASAAETARRGARPRAPLPRETAVLPPARRHRPSLPSLATAAVTVAVLATVTLLWSGVGHRPSSRAVRPGPAGRTSTTTSARSAAAPPPPTATTPPPARAPALVARDSAGAVFAVGHVGFALTVTATADCWTQVRSAPDGTVLFEDTLGPGATRTFAAANRVWVRLGAPGAVTLRVDGVAIDAGGDPNVPTDVDLVGAGNAA